MCNCIPGFQITMANSVYSCTQCPPGKFKQLQNNEPCKNWTVLDCDSTGQYAAAGTRTSDSKCVDFPLPPVNAYTVTDRPQWECNAGYEKV
jgi:hypothetical protein